LAKGHALEVDQEIADVLMARIANDAPVGRNLICEHRFRFPASVPEASGEAQLWTSRHHWHRYITHKYIVFAYN
jgi:hypothetical protein